MGRPYSDEIYALLERAGEHRTSTAGSRAGWVLSFQNRKWLLRPSHAGPCVWASIRSGGLRHWLRSLRWLLGIRLVRLHSDQGVRWVWARVRDKEHKKISFFDAVGRRKHTYWADRKDFDRELSMQHRFACHGVSTVPFESSDPSRLVAVQPLVGTMFAHAESLSPIDAQLLEYVVATSTLKPAADYLTSVGRLVEGGAPEAVAFRTAAEGLARVAPPGDHGIPPVPMTPVTIVHGDLSRQNILRNDDGQAFLIDFDRSFEASAYYDFVFAGLFTEAFGLERAGEHAAAINARLMPEARLSGGDALVHALSLFVLDNIVYLNQPHVGTSSRALTRKVIGRALRALGSRGGQ